MRVLRVIGYVGLAMLFAVMALSIHLSPASGSYRGAFVGAGALVVFAVFGNILWVSGRRQQVPFASAAPSRTLFLAFFLVLGLGALAVSVERLIDGAYLSALIALAASLLLLGEVYRAWPKRA